MRFLTILCLGLTLISTGHVGAQSITANQTNLFVSPVIPCAYPLNLNDGCIGAHPGGQFTAQGYFGYSGSWGNYVRQSGQGWTGGDKPYSFHLAGVDYAIGNWTPQAQLLDPTITPPSGCTYSSSLHRVTCTGANPVIAGYDFSLHNCTVLEFSAAVSGTVDIHNNYFKNGSNCAIANGYLVKYDAGGTNVINFSFSQNTVDGDYLNNPADMAAGLVIDRCGAVVGGCAGTTLITYNAFVNLSNRVINDIMQTAAYQVSFNYIQGFNMLPQANCQGAGAFGLCQHGEIDDIGSCAGCNIVSPSILWSYNAIVVPAATRVGCCTTSIWHASGTTTATWDSTTDDSNVIVTNLAGGAAGISPCTATGTVSGTTLTLTSLGNCPSTIPGGSIVGATSIGIGITTDSLITTVSQAWNGSSAVFALSRTTATPYTGSMILSSATVAGAADEFQGDTFIATAETNNYLDWTGAGSGVFFCWYTTSTTAFPASPVFLGNLSLLSGNTIAVYSIKTGLPGCS